MIEVGKAYEKAKAEIEKMGAHITDKVWEDKDCYVFSTKEELDMDPIAIDKDGGNIDIYFPPDHSGKGKWLTKGVDF